MPSDMLDEARGACRREAWRTAYDAFNAVDRAAPLEAPDLELLARSAYMLSLDDDYCAALDRAHQIWLDAGETARAARCGFWIGLARVVQGEHALGMGWFARMQRMLDSDGLDCCEHGYLKLPAMLQAMDSGEHERAREMAAEIAAIAERFGDADLLWMARHELAHALLHLRRDEEALRLFDEALVAAGADGLSPVVAGILYCNIIDICRAHFALRHARVWTRALHRWCERQPEMVAHNGRCLVHRAEVLLLEGQPADSLMVARETAERFATAGRNRVVAEAHYCIGEALRLRGDLDAAEEAYRHTSDAGREPQPGLALLRLAQGKEDAAEAAIRRLVGERTAPLARATVLPAYVDIMLAVGKLDLAREGSRELDELAAALRREMIDALAAYARGAIALADGGPADALVHLRRAWSLWEALGVPREVARARACVGLACRALGDEDTAALELDAAARAFDALGSVTDRAWLDSVSSAPAAPVSPVSSHGLSVREIEVLRLVATGKTNREIAGEMFVSEHTVRRHVQNIFGKLDVSTRTEAASWFIRTMR